jgi:hypothetical protein
MFDQDIGKDFGLRTELLPVAESVVGIAFDETLVGEHCAGVDVYADEGSVAGGTKSERSAGIVAQDVEADGQFDCCANGATGGGHRGDGFGSDVCPGERNIAEIFDEQGMCAAAFVGAGVGNGSGDYFFQLALPARRAGEGLEVDDAEQGFTILIEEMGQRG